MGRLVRNLVFTVPVAVGCLVVGVAMTTTDQFSGAAGYDDPQTRIVSVGTDLVAVQAKPEGAMERLLPQSVRKLRGQVLLAVMYAGLLMLTLAAVWRRAGLEGARPPIDDRRHVVAGRAPPAFTLL